MGTEGERFYDEGTYLAEFRGVIDVRCPRCAAHAAVRSPVDGSDGRVACSHCGFSASQDEDGWLGPMRGVARRRCPSSGHWMERTSNGPRHDHLAHLVCECGWDCQEPYRWDRLPLGIIDPVFGLDLWLQAPFRGEVLWAYNGEHLAFLRDYVAADLRERMPKRNRSLVARLPAWIKSAKNRDDLLGAIAKLEAMASN